MIKNIIYSIYSIYALLAFFIFMPIVVPFYLIVAYLPGLKERQRTLAMLWANNMFILGWSILTGVPLRRTGHENIDPNQTYVFVANHVNMLDITLIGRFFNHYGKPLAKKEIGKIPLVGILFRYTSFLVDRSSAQSRKMALYNMIDALKEGCSLVILPEGTRNRSNLPLRDFHAGAFKVAIAAQVPIVPMVLIGLRHLQPVESFRLYPGKITLKYLPPIPTVGLTDADTEDLKQQVFEAIKATLLAEDAYWKGWQTAENAQLHNTIK